MTCMLTPILIGSCCLASGTARQIEWVDRFGVDLHVEGFVTTSEDSRMTSAVLEDPIRPDQHFLLIEVKANTPARMQLFWMRGHELPAEARSASLQIAASKDYVPYVLDLAVNSGFNGADQLRLDPADGPGTVFDIRRLDFVAAEDIPPSLIADLVEFCCYSSKLHYLPGEGIDYLSELLARYYPDRASSKILKVELRNDAGHVVDTAVHQYGLRPGQVYKIIQGRFEPDSPLAPGRYTLCALSIDQRSGLRLEAQHIFGIQGPDDPFVYETPFKFIKDFSIIKGPKGRYHIFSITGDLFANHDWVPDGQERTFSHASSQDLRHWTIHPPVISISDQPYPDGRGRFKDRNVWAPHVIERDGRYWMFYTSVNQHLSQSISLAMSPDLFEWTEYEHNPVFTPEGIEWVNWARDSWGDCRDPMVLREGDVFYLYATVNLKPPGETGGVIVVQSTDLLHWHQPRIAVRGRMVSESPHVFKIGDRFFMATSSIGAATYASNHPATGWHRIDFSRPDVQAAERWVSTSRGWAEEVIHWDTNELLMGVITFRHRGNSIYLFRMKTREDLTTEYQSPWALDAD